MYTPRGGGGVSTKVVQRIVKFGIFGHCIPFRGTFNIAVSRELYNVQYVTNGWS